MSKTIGFIGLGNMGKPMAMNLIKAGYEMVLFDKFADLKALESDKVRVAASVKETSVLSDVVITMLPADQHILEVYKGDEGIVLNMKDGGCCIDMTSCRGETIIEIENYAKESGRSLSFVDAPVSGGVPAATGGTLTIMTGGKKEVLEACSDIINVLGTRIFYTGDLGSGKYIKMINQFLNAGNTYIASEALYMARAMNLDLNLLSTVVNASSGGSWIFENNVPKHMYTGDFESGFKLDLMKKDIGLTIEQAHKDHISLPVMNLIYQIYEAMSNQGNGSKSYNIVSTWIDQQNRKQDLK